MAKYFHKFLKMLCHFNGVSKIGRDFIRFEKISRLLKIFQRILRDFDKFNEINMYYIGF